jgi:hypothetical protein
LPSFASFSPFSTAAAATLTDAVFSVQSEDRWKIIILGIQLHPFSNH